MRKIATIIWLFTSFLAIGQPGSEDKFLSQGVKALNEGLFEAAIQNFNQSIEKNKESTWSYVYRGLAKGSSGDPKGAKKDFTEAIKLEPDLGVAYEYRATLACSQAMAFESRGNGEAPYNLDFKQAAEDYTMAIKYNSDAPELYNNRGYCYLKMRKFDKAIEDCNKAIALDPNYLLAYATRGWAFYESGDYKRAEEDLKVAMGIERESEHYETILEHYTQAALALKSGVPSTKHVASSIEKPGTYYALLIGNNEYPDANINNLDKPIKDAEGLYNVLLNKYTFEKENVVFLKNASRGDIIEALDNLSDKMTKNDNLVIFYGGHGYWDAKKETGYWLPVDSRKDRTTNWLRNSTIQGYIDDIPSRHTLLIADACFGGGIFKTRAAFEDAPPSIEKLYELPSRKGMTSGMLTEVPDKSVFMEFLVKRLDENEQKYMSSMSLFTNFREAVMNNSNNAPQYGTIHNSGDEGGDFIFVLKD